MKMSDLARRLLSTLALMHSTEGVRVVSTDPSRWYPHQNGSAEILNSSLAGHAELTLCARFLTFRYNLDHESLTYDYQTLITNRKYGWLLASYTGKVHSETELFFS